MAKTVKQGKYDSHTPGKAVKSSAIGGPPDAPNGPPKGGAIHNSHKGAVGKELNRNRTVTSNPAAGNSDGLGKGGDGAGNLPKGKPGVGGSAGY